MGEPPPGDGAGRREHSAAPSGGAAHDDGRGNGLAGRYAIDRDSATAAIMVARGLGGRLELYPDRVRIVRDGYFNYLLGILARRPALIETTIALEQIAAFDIVHPVLFNDFVYVAYPGSPPLTGHSLQDSTAENALLMNFFDNRRFYTIKRRIDAMISRPIYVTVRGKNRVRGDRSDPDTEGGLARDQA
jgi:hypothetical protein